MKIFFPNASIKYPVQQGPDVHRYQVVRQLTRLGHVVTSLKPDENPETSTYPRSLRSVTVLSRAADALYIRIDEGVTAATLLTHPLVAPLLRSSTAAIWEFNLSPLVAVRQSDGGAVGVRHLRTLARCARRVDAYIAVSQGVADDVTSALGIPDVRVIENASDPDIFGYDPLQKSQRDEPLRVAWIGSHDNRIHDFDLLHSLAAFINASDAPVELHLFGATEHRFVDVLSARVRHHGVVVYSELAQFLRMVDIGLVLYKGRCDGGSPLKLYDYMASGCLPISSPGVSAEGVRANTGVGLVQEWNAEQLLECLLRLGTNRNQLVTLQRDARRAAETHYSWEGVGQRIEAVILEALTRRRKK